MVTISEAASFDLMPSLLSLALILKSPTPPAKEAGAPAGRSRTLTWIVGVLIRLRRVWYWSKKSSKIYSGLPEEVRTRTWQTISAGSMVSVPLCWGIRTYCLRSAEL